ncbi:MAG: phage/plasmid replication protein, II/X family [Gammaproteobacteria bacterium]|nr:phage/plasmid replication protein, II/X family [Gammaproteobacteria bacterium]
MIDWLTMELEYHHHPVKTGSILSVSPDGELEYQIVKRLPVRGSYSSNVLIRSGGAAGENVATKLQICGNPTKFLNGHNVVGSRDLCQLAHDMCKKLFNQLDWLFSSSISKKLLSGEFKVTRIDINDYLEFDSLENALSWQKAAVACSTSRQGSFTHKGTTSYIGQFSRRVMIKLYSKYLELTQGKKGHKLPLELPHQEQLLNYVKNKIRAEITFRSMFLKDNNLSTARELTPAKINEIYLRQLGKITMNSQVKLKPHEALNIPKHLISSYMLWSDGFSLYDELPKPTFYRHRKALLAFGIDIKIPPVKQASNVIPLMRIIEAKQVSNMPTWCNKVGLIHEKRRA